MTTILRVLAFSALLVLVILAGTRLGRSAEGLGAPGPLPVSLAALRDAGAELVPLGRAGVLDGWLVRRADGSLLTVSMQRPAGMSWRDCFMARTGWR